MKKVNEIFNNKKYKLYVNELKILEKDRIFCKHGIEHSLDVARISYIKVLENNLKYSKEVIYAAALLHDLGRILEYKQNIPHNISGVKIAEELLQNTSFDLDEKIEIICAIINHREKIDSKIYDYNDYSKDNNRLITLAKIIKQSDKESRNCFDCISISDCYWHNDKKNFNIQI